MERPAGRDCQWRTGNQYPAKVARKSSKAPPSHFRPPAARDLSTTPLTMAGSLPAIDRSDQGTLLLLMIPVSALAGLRLKPKSARENFQMIVR
jgi:hypothetical protein